MGCGARDCAVAGLQRSPTQRAPPQLGGVGVAGTLAVPGTACLLRGSRLQTPFVFLLAEGSDGSRFPSPAWMAFRSLSPAAVGAFPQAKNMLWAVCSMSYTGLRGRLWGHSQFSSLAKTPSSVEAIHQLLESSALCSPAFAAAGKVRRSRVSCLCLLGATYLSWAAFPLLHS